MTRTGRGRAGLNPERGRTGGHESGRGRGGGGVGFTLDGEGDGQGRGEVK